MTSKLMKYKACIIWTMCYVMFLLDGKDVKIQKHLLFSTKDRKSYGIRVKKRWQDFHFYLNFFIAVQHSSQLVSQRLKQPPLGVDTETCLSICHTCPLHENSWFCKELTECFLDICSESRQKALEAAEMKRERESERCLRWFGQPALLNSSSACLKSSFIFI